MYFAPSAFAEFMASVSLARDGDVDTPAVQTRLVERRLDLGRFFPEEACQLHFLVSGGSYLRQGSVIIFFEFVFYRIKLQAHGTSERVGIQPKRDWQPLPQLPLLPHHSESGILALKLSCSALLSVFLGTALLN